MDKDSGCVIWDTCPSDKEADWCRFIKILDCFFFQSILVEKSNLRKWPASILRRKKNFFCRVTPSSHTLCQGCVSYQIIAYFTRSKKLINAGVKCTIQRWRNPKDDKQHQPRLHKHGGDVNVRPRSQSPPGLSPSQAYLAYGCLLHSLTLV